MLKAVLAYPDGANMTLSRMCRLLFVSMLAAGVLATAVPVRALEVGAAVTAPGGSATVTVDLGAASTSTEALGWDGAASSGLDHVAEAIGADRLAAQGLTGAGVGVALIDTGVADVAWLDEVWRGPDLSLDQPLPGAYGQDHYGHGTHLAGIIASTHPDAMGLAPGADLISLKIGARNGAVDVTQAIAAIDWVVQHRDAHNIRVLVLAYGTDGAQDPAIDPLSHAVQNAWDAGIVVTVAVGNHGDSRDPVVNPATNPSVIAVGAVDTRATAATSDDEVPSFSAPGTPARRPDVFAPGVGIVSLRAPGGYLDQSYPRARRADDLFSGNGSSQASAVVGAAAALLLEDRPWLTPDQVKAVLSRSARRLDNALTGEGVIDLAAAQLLPGTLASQHHPPTSGTGTIEGARGGTHLGQTAALLAGEQDVRGHALDTASWAIASRDGTSWIEGSWNGNRWAGTDWDDRTLEPVSWDGAAWNGQVWDEVAWHGWSWHGWSWHGWSWHSWSWR